MKASELIIRLQEQIEQYGDREVYFDCEVQIDGFYKDYCLDKGDCVNSVYFNNKEKNIHIC